MAAGVEEVRAGDGFAGSPGWKNMRNTGVLHDHNAKKRLTLQPPDAATGGGRCRDALAMVLLNAAISYGIVRLNAPVTAAFNMKQTVDAFF